MRLHVLEVALKCSTRTEFLTKYPGAYNRAKRDGYLEKCFKHMIFPNNIFEKDLYFIVSRFCKTIYIGISCKPSKRFIEHKSKGTKLVKDLIFNKKGYLKIVDKKLSFQEALKKENYWIRYFKKKNWKVVNQVKGYSLGYNPLYWTEAKIKEEILNFKGKSRTEFKNKYPGAYKRACKSKLIKLLHEKIPSKNFENKVEVNKKLFTFTELSRLYNIKKGTLIMRYKRGKRGLDLIKPVKTKQIKQILIT